MKACDAWRKLFPTFQIEFHQHNDFSDNETFTSISVRNVVLYYEWESHVTFWHVIFQLSRQPLLCCVALAMFCCGMAFLVKWLVTGIIYMAHNYKSWLAGRLSYGLDWYEYTIATLWYQFHITDIDIHGWDDLIRYHSSHTNCFAYDQLKLWSSTVYWLFT